jgi:hypothetical protein
VTEKVHSPGVEQACGECGSVGSERGSFLGELLPGECVCAIFPVTSA